MKASLRIWFLALVSLTTQFAHSATITVSAAPGGSGCTLMSAIFSANADIGISGCTAGDGDDIISVPSSLGPHTYTNSLGGSNNALPTITTNIFIQGTGGKVVLQRAGANLTRFFSINASAVLTIENLTLMNGAAVVDSSDSGGGAIKVKPSGALFVFDSLLVGNRAEGFSGGAITAENASVVIFDSVLKDNFAGRSGAIEIRGSNLSIGESVIERNFSNTPNSIGAGGISATNSTVTITDTQFLGNTAIRTGGGLKLLNSSTVIRRSLFAENKALDLNVSSRGRGGAIEIGSFVGETDTSVVDIYDTTITENNASSGAGISVFLRENKSLNFYNSTIAFNTALPGTDAISPGISISGSRDLSTPSSSVSFINTIIAGNGINSTSGQEIGSYIKANYEVTFRNSLIGHSAITLAEAIRSNTTSGGIAIAPPPSSNIRAYSDGPESTPLTKILSLQRSELTHPLVAGSPAIDNATDGFFATPFIFTVWVPGCRGEEIEVTTTPPVFRVDQRKEMRPGGSQCDIGAVEFSDQSSCFVIKSSNNRVINFCL